MPISILLLAFRVCWSTGGSWPLATPGFDPFVMLVNTKHTFYPQSPELALSIHCGTLSDATLNLVTDAENPRAGFLGWHP